MLTLQYLGYKKIQMGVIKSLESLKKSNPDLSEAIDVKIAAARKRMSDDHLPLSQVRLWLEKCGETFDEVESQLTKMKAGMFDHLSKGKFAHRPYLMYVYSLFVIFTYLVLNIDKFCCMS